MDLSTRERVQAQAPLLMERLLQPQGGLFIVRFSTTSTLAAALRNLQFSYTLAQPWGPLGGRQLFFTNGLVTVRAKSLGDKAGPRENRPHISVGLTNGNPGNAWCDDVAKINSSGQLAAKSIMLPERFNPIDHDKNPQRFVMIQGGLTLERLGAQGVAAAGDAWGDRTHFSFPNNQVIDDLGMPE